jgi:ABC-2 type transport system ATP-binding protein
VAEEICTRVGVVADGCLVSERWPAEMDAGESLLDAFVEEVEDSPTTEPRSPPKP